MPQLSETNHPDRQQWLKEVQQALVGVDPAHLVIVGHSLGVTTALDFLEQSQDEVHGLVSVSGFAMDYGLELNSYFLREKDIDLEVVKQHLDAAVVLYGDNDPYVTQEALRQLADGLGVEPIVIAKGGHLNTEAGFTTFPRLLEAVRQLL